MKARVVISVLLNVIAVIGPAAVLYSLYGLGSTVDPESGRDLLAILGSALFAFFVGLGASTLLKGMDKSFLVKLVEDVVQGREVPVVKRRRHSKQAA